MAQVNVTINGRAFRIACDDGQEQQLEALADDLNLRVEGMRGTFGEIGDTRLTVMAAIQIADDLREADKRIRRLEEELTALQDARLVAADREKQTQAALVAAFDSAAERIESVARTLNQSIAPPAAMG